MFAAAIIVFRESLEAALIISVMIAATRGLAMRGRWVLGGILAGVGGACFVASFMQMIANMVDGMGQELFNVGILLTAVAMLAWHNIWMASHSRELVQQMKNTARAVTDGRSERSVIFLVIALAVMREGSETALFLYGVATDSANGIRNTLAGGTMGLAAGALVATSLYAGLLRIPVRWFFAATSALVLLMAASMASQAARMLIQADLLPSLATPIWDTSNILSQNTVAGTILHGLIGYDAQPAGMQLVVYLGVLLVIVVGMMWVSRRATPSLTTSVESG
jgi:high-affinity iron transporter